MTLQKKVKFASANGTNVWAPDDTNTSLELIDGRNGQENQQNNLVVQPGYSFAKRGGSSCVFRYPALPNDLETPGRLWIRTDDLKASETCAVLLRNPTWSVHWRRSMPVQQAIRFMLPVSSAKDVDTCTYGNGTFVISDDGKDTICDAHVSNIDGKVG